MAKPLVGSARIDENGKTYGGAAGDQNGKEVVTQSWYKHSKGWRVLRHKDPDAGVRAAKAMQAACDNSSVGYDQHQRDTLLKAAAPYGYDISKVEKPCETDCSALIRVCEAFSFGRDIVAETTDDRFSTRNMVNVLLKTGLFVELEGTKYTENHEYLGIGDILCTKTQGHVVMVLGNGDKYEGTIEPKKYALGERLIQRDDTGEDVKVLQEYLLALGYDVGKYGTDGEYGPDTESAVESFQADRYPALTVDGEYGPDTHAAMMAAIEGTGGVPVISPEESGNLTVLDDSSWNVRTGPGTAYAKVGMLKPGDTVQELETAGWKTIKYNGEARFVNEGAFRPEGG